MRHQIISGMILMLLTTSIAYSQDYDDLTTQAVNERKLKNYQKAIDLCNQSINKQANARAYYVKGLCYYDMNDYESAIDNFNSTFYHYSSYYRDDKQRGYIYYYRARSKQFLKQYSAAIEDFTSAISYNYEQLAYAYWNRAAAYYSLGKYQDAVNDYSQAATRLTSNASLSSVYNYKGECLAAIKKYSEAFAAFDQSISYNPENYNAFWNRGYYKDLNGKDEEALSDYNKAIDLLKKKANGSGNEDLAILYRNRALRLIDLKKYEDAKKSIADALEVYPNYADAYETRADIYQITKEYDKARKDLDNAITLATRDKQKAVVYKRLSDMEMDILEFGKSLEALNKAVQLDSTSGYYIWRRSILYGHMKKFPLAISDATKALSKYQYDSSSTASLIWLRASHKEESGDYKGALADYQLYLKYFPESYDAYYEIARLLKWKLKNNELAVVNLDKAATLAMAAFDSSKYAYIKMVKGEKEAAIGIAMLLLEAAQTNEYDRKWALHNLACIHTMLGNTIKGLEYLDKSMAAGFDDYVHLVNDRELVALMKLPQWKAILQKYKVPSAKH